MKLTDATRTYLQGTAALMGLNGGLYYFGLISELAATRFKAKSSYKCQSIHGCILRAGDQIGHTSVGRIVYEAASQGIIEPVLPRLPGLNSSPQLTSLEEHVLEEAARLLIPKGGHFAGYTKQLRERTGYKPHFIANTLRTINEKFYSRNIEQAIIFSLAREIVDAKILDQADVPDQLRAFIEHARKQPLSPSAMPLSDEERRVGSTYIRRIGLEGGLFWKGWVEQVAASQGITVTATNHILNKISHKMGINQKGALFYAISDYIQEPIRVTLPSPSAAHIKLSPPLLALMSESARRALPACGYYFGIVDDIVKTLNIPRNTANRMFQEALERTGVPTIGQAITLLITQGVISPPMLSTIKSPALDAIMQACQQSKQNAA